MSKLKMFNTMFQTKIGEGQYSKGHKKTKHETKKAVIDVISEVSKNVSDDKVFDGKSLINKYESQKFTTKEVIDKVVEFMLDLALEDIKKSLKIKDIIDKAKDKIVVSSLIDSVLSTALEEIFSQGVQDDEEACVEIVMEKLFESMNSNREYYKMAPAELFLGPIKDKSSEFILEFNAKQLLRYLKVNYYVDFSEKKSA